MSGKAQNELGKLFVDIGLGGVGKAIKGLNTVSASFLMVKTAATQTLKPFVDFGKETANNAIQIGKMSSMFGFTMTEYQKLIRYFKDHKVSESLVGDMTSLSDMFTKFQKRLASPSYMQQYAANMLGIGNLLDYSGSIQDVTKFVEKVQEGVRGMDTESARMFMKELGMQAEWLWAFQQGDFKIRDAMTIPDKDVQNMIDLQVKWQKTVEDLRTFLMEFASKYAPLVLDIIGKLAPIIDKMYKSLEPSLDKIPTSVEDAKLQAKAFVAKKTLQGTMNRPDKTLSLLFGGSILGTMFNAYSASDNYVNRSLQQNGFKATPINDLSGGKDVILPKALPSTSASSNGRTNITVYNDNKITTDSPFEVAEELNNISADSILESARRNSYEKSNLSGN